MPTQIRSKFGHENSTLAPVKVLNPRVQLRSIVHAGRLVGRSPDQVVCKGDDLGADAANCVKRCVVRTCIRGSLPELYLRGVAGCRKRGSVTAAACFVWNGGVQRDAKAEGREALVLLTAIAVAAEYVAFSLSAARRR